MYSDPPSVTISASAPMGMIIFKVLSPESKPMTAQALPSARPSPLKASLTSPLRK